MANKRIELTEDFKKSNGKVLKKGTVLNHFGPTPEGMKHKVAPAPKKAAPKK